MSGLLDGAHMLYTYPEMGTVRVSYRSGRVGFEWIDGTLIVVAFEAPRERAAKLFEHLPSWASGLLEWCGAALHLSGLVFVVGAGRVPWVLEANAPARCFYERIGGRDAGVEITETHGGAVVRSCRYVWPSAAHLAEG